jgi:DNA-binding PadR family transcriptional regulator
MKHQEQPLSPNAFYILFALTQGNAHGYSIMQDARKLSAGAVRMGPATLYTTIQRLLDQSMIEEVDGPDDADSRRRYYHLTKDGSTAFHLELDRMESAVRKAKALHLRTAESRS